MSLNGFLRGRGEERRLDPRCERERDGLMERTRASSLQYSILGARVHWMARGSKKEKEDGRETRFILLRLNGSLILSKKGKKTLLEIHFRPL